MFKRQVCLISLIAILMGWCAGYARAEVHITGMQDMSFNTSGSLERELGLCIYNSDSDSYQITVTQNSGGSPEFSLVSTSNSSNILPYSVSFKGSQGSEKTMSSGGSWTFSAAFRGSSTPCPGSTNAWLKVSFDSTDVHNAHAGTYTGSFTVLLTAN